MLATFSNFLSSLTGNIQLNIPAQQSYGGVLCAVIGVIQTRIEYRQLTYKAKEIFYRIGVRES